MSNAGNPVPVADKQRRRRSARRWRLGIETRLALSFAAVAVLAVAANLIVEHGVAIIETTEFRFSGKAPAPPPVAASPPAPLQPAAIPPPAMQAEIDLSAFLSSVEQLHLAAQARLQVDDAPRRLEYEKAARELTRQAALLPSPPQQAAAEAEESRMAKLVRAYTQRAGNAVKVADTRREQIARYRKDLSILAASVSQAIDRGWKVLGRVVARQSLIDLGRGLQSIEDRSVVLNARDYRDAAGMESLRLSEEQFAALLGKHRDSLRKSQGEPWERRFTADFDSLAATRVAAIGADQNLRATVSRLETERTSIVAAARAIARETPESQASTQDRAAAAPEPTIAAPAVSVQPVPEERVERRVSRATAPETAQARKWVVWITIAVLGCILALTLSTIESIVRPVRRLILATRRLGEGGHVAVERGGIRELDELAVAFNDMASQLASARAALVSHQQKLEERVQERTLALKHLAEHDSLTELPNRRLLLERLEAAVQSARTSGGHVGVYFVDLDNFKNINDSMGHEYGDQVLLSVSQRLAEVTAAFGLAGRLGGDEFTILFPAAPDPDAVAAMGEVILRAFQRPLQVGDRELTLSASVGASVFPEHGAQPETLLRAADAALFRAKALGRNQLHLFSPDLVEMAHTKFVIEQGLRRAIEQGEFEIVYQPEIDVATLQPALVEALLRWRTPDGRLLTPDAFLGVAEESGLIADLSDWVLRTVIAAAAAWHHGDWPAVRVAINVSPRQLVDLKFVNRVEELLRQHALPPRCIELELTENLLQTGASTIEALRRLRACGIAIALDDFGTGYSSFASLEMLPLTRVKLDRSLIASVDSRSPASAIATSIIGLCRRLGFEVTAEGVERPLQLSTLIEQGATHIQGYLVSRPVAHDDLLTELRILRGRMVSIMLTLPESAGASPAREAFLQAPEPAPVARAG